MPPIKIAKVEAQEPREFCRICFGISHLNVEDIVEYESESGYRKKCVKLLAKVTGRGERTVRSWGAGIKFEEMPECYKLTLAYALKAIQLDAKKQVA